MIRYVHTTPLGVDLRITDVARWRIGPELWVGFSTPEGESVGDQISESRDFPAVTFPMSWRLKHAIRARAKFSSRQGDIPRICNLSPERRARASTKSQSWSV